MADKITNLKNQTGDNVYPNVIGENRKDSFSDSSTIKHYYYAKTHKVGFQLANETNTKIQNSLQKPVGLTKTELVGVGTNGQENIEIGDNLKLENGKLSATGGGGEEFNELIINNYLTENDILEIGYFLTGSSEFKGINMITKKLGKEVYFPNDKPVKVIINLDGSPIVYYAYKEITGYGICYFMTSAWASTFKTLILGYLVGTYADSTQIDSIKFFVIGDMQKPIFSHFITMINSHDGIVLYLTIQNITDTTFTADTLASYLAGKKVLANGNLHEMVPTYIAGEGGTIKVYYRIPGGSDIYPQPDVFADLSSFDISDLVTLVE